MTLVFYKRKVFEIMKPIPQDYTEENIFNQQLRLRSGEKLNKITWNFILRTVTSSEELRWRCDIVRKNTRFWKEKTSAPRLTSCSIWIHLRNLPGLRFHPVNPTVTTRASNSWSCCLGQMGCGLCQSPPGKGALSVKDSALHCNRQRN